VADCGAYAGGETGIVEGRRTPIGGAPAIVPIGRIGEAEEFANLACFIASDAASYITCVAINIDGGSSPVV